MDTHLQDTTIVGPVKPIVKRRKYSKALKRRIVEECLAGNASASVVARRHDINANLYSLIESAKASGLEPYQYLRQVFTELPQAETVEDIENLLPWSVKKIPAENV